MLKKIKEKFFFLLDYLRYGQPHVIHFDASSLEEAFDKFKEHLGAVHLWTEYRTRKAFMLRESEAFDLLSFTITGHVLTIESVIIDKAGNHQVMAYDTPKGFVSYTTTVDRARNLKPQEAWNDKGERRVLD